MISTLTRSEVRKLSLILRKAGWKLPLLGHSVLVPKDQASEFQSHAGFVPGRVGHDDGGYYFTKWERHTLPTEKVN